MRPLGSWLCQVEEEDLRIVVCLEPQGYLVADGGAVAGAKLLAIQEYVAPRHLDPGVAARWR